jgi:hypothetical protein
MITLQILAWLGVLAAWTYAGLVSFKKIKPDGGVSAFLNVLSIGLTAPIYIATGLFQPLAIAGIFTVLVVAGYIYTKIQNAILIDEVI